jgi:hypothetical protein
MPSKKRKAVELIEPKNDESSWAINEKHLTEIINYSKVLTKSQRRAKLFEYKSTGYTAIVLSDYCMSLLSDGYIQMTLSNMVKYGSENDDVNGSTFVFQKPGKSAEAPELSHTRSVL